MTSHSRGRWTPFWVSLTFAAVFIALRIAYRLVFGSFSWQAIGQAASLALPFAIVIVICGFLSALVDVRKLLPSMSVLRHGRSVGTALAIALSSYPTLIHQVKQLDGARKLRKMSSRSAFLVPLLEHTIERAVALAAAMDLRGFGTSSRTTAEPGDITFTNFSLRYDNTEVLRDVNLTLPGGSLTVIAAQTGSGKTALLESIAGLTQHFHYGQVQGTLTIGSVDRKTAAPRETSGLIGFVPQDVRLGFAAATAREELEFGMRVSGHSRAEAGARANELIDQFSLAAFSDQPIELLSSGEATRVAIAAALAQQPQILLLDEPLADLDQSARKELIALLHELHTTTETTIVIVEHHTAGLEALNPTWLTLEDGVLAEGRYDPAPLSSPARTTAVVGSDEILQVKDLSFSHGARTIFSDVSFTTHVGEIIALTGANGAGKSTLLSQLAFEFPNKIVLVPELVSSLFIAETLEEELTRADVVAGVSGTGLTAMTFWSILGREESVELLGTHPRDLSAGTQLALAIALQLSWKPQVILIDEPTRGLDTPSRESMAEVLRCVAETGTAVIVASHDEDFVSTLGCRFLTLHDGVLAPMAVKA